MGNASLLGYAPGTAPGMASRSRVAAYKVCWSVGCFGSDILAGMDQAISNDVDALSLSLGGGSAPYYRDTIAIRAFTAVETGIFVSCSAGNSGPIRASLANSGGGVGVFRSVVGKWTCNCVCGSGLVLVVGFFFFFFFLLWTAAGGVGGGGGGGGGCACG